MNVNSGIARTESLASKSNGHTTGLVEVRPPQEVAGRACACGAIRRASRSITQLYDLVLAPTGMKATQFFILLTIRQAGEIAQCQLARDHDLSVETLSRRLGGLRRKGLVELRQGPANREHVYTLTEAGQRRLQEAEPYWERAQQRLRAVVGEDGWELLFAFTERLTEGAHEASALRTSNHAVSGRA